jgi:hypothetical protein
MVVTSSPKAADGQQETRPVVAVLVVGFILTLAIHDGGCGAEPRAWPPQEGPPAPSRFIETPASALSSSEGFRSSQLTPTVGQRAETNGGQRADTNGKVEAETAPNREVTSSGIDF